MRAKQRADSFEGRSEARRKIRQAVAKRRYERNRNYVYSYKKGKPCADCKRFYSPASLHFDHLPEFQKSSGISKMVGANSIARIQEEIEKCEIVCVNCHRDRTHQRCLVKEKGRTYPVRETLQKAVDEIKRKSPCSSCGDYYKSWQMDYHHRNHETKTATISTMIGRNKPLAEILEEIKKCDILCGNCHAVVSAEELNHEKHITNAEDS